MGNGPRQLGHLVVNVRDLNRAEDFYTNIIGLKVMQKYDGHAVFMSANDAMSHELALVGVGEDAPGPEKERIGLLHMAWQMDSLEDLKAINQRLKDNGVEIEHYGDHGVSLGIYFRDPDGNEIETYYEVPREDWILDGDHLFDQRNVHVGARDVAEILE